MTVKVLLLLFFFATASSKEQAITEAVIAEQTMTKEAMNEPANLADPSDETKITESAKRNFDESSPAILNTTIDNTNASNANPVHPAEDTNITESAKLNYIAIPDNSTTHKTTTSVAKTNSADGSKPDSESTTTMAIDINNMAIDINTTNSSIIDTKAPASQTLSPLTSTPVVRTATLSQTSQAHKPDTSGSAASLLALVFFGGVFTVLITGVLAFAWMRKYHNYHMRRFSMRIL